MFSYIKGTVENLATDYAVVENNGIGYKLFVPASQIGLFPQRGNEIKLYTYLQVKEDGLVLFGFLDNDSLGIFRQLLGVSGVGAKSALGILSVMTPNDLRTAILTQDAKGISKAPGIGAKTAQRIIIDLKDKVSLDDIMPGGDSVSSGEFSVKLSVAKQEAADALIALGYSAKEAKDAVARIEEEDSMTVEDYLKKALTFMG